jgi:hypothetical protein
MAASEAAPENSIIVNSQAELPVAGELEHEEDRD